MSLSIRIICSPDGESISEWTKLFPANGGEIGRAYGSTMQLSDSSRTISSTHAIIRKSSRGYQILDNSTNGLFINGADKPLGKNSQTALNDGDVLSIGKYRLLVSCFLPATAKAAPLSETEAGSSIGNDPFSTPNNIDVEPPVMDIEEPTFEFERTGSEVLEDDPFLIDTEKSAAKQKSFSTSFAEVDEDPLKETTLDFNLNTINQDRIDPVFNDPQPNVEPTVGEQLFEPSKEDKQPPQDDVKYSVAQYKSKEERFNQYTEQAIDYAITKILAEMSPESMEGMFTDLVPKTFWSKKPDFWSMYKRYFERQMNNKDWQIKFHAYFQEGIRLQRNIGEHS
ncbi:hypothetical protein SOPP22_13460 [Shewanella sp. OPT22]|nr:hypothetical protein SOPP22_13460 [Shewanella sp. OPT22]